MNLEEINFIIIPGIIITFTSILMPTFFLELNKVETCNRKLSSKPLLIFIISTLLIYYCGGSFFANTVSDKVLYYFLSFMFLLKWALLNLGITYIRKKYDIN